MKTDPIRIKSYFAEIRKNSSELNQLIDQNELKAESLPLKAAKYLLISLPRQCPKRSSISWRRKRVSRFPDISILS